MLKIFVTYRREDAEADAGRLVDRLKRSFGKRNVFRDVDNLALGHDFESALKKALDQCDVAIVVIGKSWLSCPNPTTGTRRLDETNDWVRTEVRTTLERGIPVVPVLVQGATLPSEAELPGELKQLVTRHATSLVADQWDSSVADLIRRLDHVVPASWVAIAWRWLVRLSARAVAVSSAALLVAAVTAVLVSKYGARSDESTPPLPARPNSQPSPVAVASPSAVTPPMPELRMTPLSGANAPRPLDGYDLIRVRTTAQAETGPAIVYPRGAHITFDVAHDRKSDASITLRGIRLIVDSFQAGEQPRYAYKGKGDQVIGAGPMKPLVYHVALFGKRVGPAIRIKDPKRGTGATAKGPNFFDTDDHELVRLSPQDDSQSIDVDVTAEEPGLYEISFVLTYSVLGTTKDRPSSPPIWIYYDGR